MKNYIYIIYFCLLFNCHQAFAQSPYLQQITDREGLPSMIVYDIMQDAQGYIWLGTEAGICRYDGIHFETFKVSQAKGKSFTTLQQDAEGRIYFTNFSKQLFYIYQGKAHLVSLPPPLHKKGIDSYTIDHRNRLWVSGHRGLIFVKTEPSQPWKSLGRYAPSNVIGAKFFLDPEGKVWIMHHKILVQTDEQFKAKLKTKVGTKNQIVKLVFVGQEIVASDDRGVLYRIHLDQNHSWKPVFQDTELVKNKLVMLVADHQENIWACTYQGVNLYPRRSRSVENKFTFLKNKFVSNMMQDREQNYWFTTIGNGLFKMANKDIVHFNVQNSALDFDQINCMVQDSKGNLFLGTNGDQLYYFDTKKQRITHKYPLPFGDVECMLLDNVRQKLYLENYKVLVFDLQNMTRSDVFWMGSTPKSFGTYQNKYLITASGNQSYISHLERSKRFKPIDLLSKVPQDSTRNLKRLRPTRSRVVWVDTHKPRFWIGYDDGLFYYENNQEREFKTTNQQTIIALDINQDADGIIWVGTAQQGVFAIKDQQIVQHLNTGNELMSDYCRKVFKEGQVLYLGTDKGLQVHDLQTKQSRFFNQADGLPGNEIRDFIIQKEKIYLATTAGLSVLNKNFNTTNRTPPLIYITELSVHDQSQPLQKQHQFAYDHNNLTFYFTGIAFRSNGKFRYKYRMEGLDKKWNYNQSTNNLARYSALPPGKYRFQVKAINEDDIESEQMATIDIVITPPFWERWWFMALMVLSIVTIMVTIILLRSRAYRRKSNLEKALSKATLESLKLQMNPHFIFNAMGAIQHYMMANDSINSSDYLARFSRLMRAVLENSRHEYISLEEEIEMLENYLVLQNLRYEGDFEYQIIVKDALDPEMIAIPPMFAQPFIENAIEHGIAHLKDAGQIQIIFSKSNNTVCLEIIDNGIGITQALQAKQSKSIKHRSLATVITQERIGLYKQSLKKNITFEVQSLDRGTRIVFYLPYQLL